MTVKGGAKSFFLFVFIKKKLVYCLDVEKILYLCIRKKFTKTGNFPRGEKEKVFRFGKFFESDEREKMLKERRLWMLM